MSTRNSGQYSGQAAEEAARRRRVRNTLVGVVAVVVLAVGMAVWAANRTSVDAGAARPAGVLDDLGIPIGAASSPVMDVYVDYQCPICKVVEESIGPAVAELVGDGRVRVVYHLMSFLDRNLDNDSSRRAANAAGCAQDQGAFAAFHEQVYANQPAVEGDGFTDEQLLAFGAGAGVADMPRFEACVLDGTFADWVAQVELGAENDQIPGTPTILVDGAQVHLRQVPPGEDFIDRLTAAIDAAS